MATQTTRRSFVKHMAIAGATLPFVMPKLVRAESANGQLNVAFIATGGKGRAHVHYAHKLNCNCHAYCDVDTARYFEAPEYYPKATGYQDYRKMFDKEHKKIDAVFIATPDHHHYLPSMIALSLDKHTYTQKPLTWSVWEARQLAKMAAKHDKVATQMGNQGHTGEGWRLVYEWIHSDVIGTVKDVHVWTNRPVWPQGVSRSAFDAKAKPPSTLDWDLWLGPAAERPYLGAPLKPIPNTMVNGSPYHEFNWRGWWDFGAGALGDMACHTMDGLFWAMNPGHPVSIEPIAATDHNNDSFPRAGAVKWTFAANDKRPGFAAHWYDGHLRPPVPADMDPGRSLPKTGCMFVGSKGTIVVGGDYGDTPRVYPLELFKKHRNPPQLLERAPGDNTLQMEERHTMEFLMAARGEKPVNFTKSHFGYAGPMTETIQLGNVALRVNRKIYWDGPNMKITNLPEANQYIKREPRPGWDFGGTI